MKNKYWYAVQTLSGSEKIAQEKFKSEFGDRYATFLPVRELQIRKRGKMTRQKNPLFPGYIFLGSAPPLDVQTSKRILLALREKSGKQIIFQILGVDTSEDLNGDVLLHPVLQAEMDVIFSLTDSNGEIGFSRYVKEGAHVTLLDGPLKGKEFLVKKVDPRKKRITIEIELLGKYHRLDVGGEAVVPTF